VGQVLGPYGMVGIQASVTDRTAVYGPVRTVVWQGSAGNRRPYADQYGKLSRIERQCFRGLLTVMLLSATDICDKLSLGFAGVTFRDK